MDSFLYIGITTTSTASRKAGNWSYCPAKTYPVYRTIYDQMIKSFDVIPQNSSAVNPAVSTYQNRHYGIQIQYPSDWNVQESTASGTPINIATFVSPTGPDSDPTADVFIYLDKLHNFTTALNNYAHFVAFADYENRTSYFHTFKLLELSTNSSIPAGKPAYTIIGTYQKSSAGLQKLMEVGTIIGDKAYSVQYIADAPKYTDYLSTVQKMIQSLQIKSQFVPTPSSAPGREIVTGPNRTMTMTQGNISATLRAPPGTNVTHFGIIPEQASIKMDYFYKQHMD